MDGRRNIEAFSHEHVFLGERHDENARRTLWVVLLTAAMMAGEIVAGVVFNSMALLADGFHMATHAGALAVAAGAYTYARRNAHNPRFVFGTGKVGDLAGFASAFALAMIALGVGLESAARLFDPQPVAFGEAALIAALGLAVNLASAFLLRGEHDHGHDHHAHHERHEHGHRRDEGGERDNNLRSAYVHVLSDALTSVLAIAALLGGRYLGWVWLDSAMGVVGAFVIALWSWSLLRDTSAVLLDMSDPRLEQEARREVEGPGDARIADLHIWRIGPNAHAAIVSVFGEADASAVRARLAPIHELAHVTVETR
ncbi:CDF family Co(II)/Ni(II) efflux transporter DmeF [Methylocella sp.]|uniref:CDF family Co(II)/Ni(II) efflux transporter DmeF n=1 Tax=Methylocella sp. TaxID=1978226 RepID=UPI0037834440